MGFNKIEELLTSDSFVRWINGKASASEASGWNAWLKDDPARKRIVKEALRIETGVYFKPSKRTELASELSKLNRKVDQFESGKDRKDCKDRDSRRRSYFSLVAAATVFLIVSLAALSFIHPPDGVKKNNTSVLLTEQTEYGQKKILTLLDGSTIVLNANTSLKLQYSHTNEDIELWLDGEAYFDIVHKTGPDRRKVTVNTPDGSVEVMGTIFNINTFKSGTEVVLVKGKVKVELKNAIDKSKITHILNPGEVSRFSADDESIETHSINTELYTSWINDKLIFDETCLAQIAERIEDIYGVEFLIRDTELRQVQISGSIPNDNLPILLKALEKILQQPISRGNGKIRIGSPKNI